MMAQECTHLDSVRAVTPSADGCEDCLKTGADYRKLGVPESNLKRLDLCV